MQDSDKFIKVAKIIEKSGLSMIEMSKLMLLAAKKIHQVGITTESIKNKSMQ